ncbi:hypothetical protein [Pseudomonas fluorescens]|uniref:hypothetical protein n=1 Tax=Pseudomonas fluorescens TaxID=294 RepID=UPI001CD2B35F|nr:hypothetical protein [Pseudomonas fluorescens]
MARGSFKITPDAYRVVPNESGSLIQYTDSVGGTDVYWFWAGFSLRKLKIDDDFKFTEIARLDLPVKLPNYQPVTPEQRLQQAAETRKFLEAKDEKGLLEYMSAQPNRMLTGTSDQVMGGAVYSLLTRDDAFIGASARRVFRIDQNDPENPASGMKLTRETQLPDELFDNEKAKRGTGLPTDVTFGMGMTLNGYLVVNTVGGVIATLDRTTLNVIDSYRVEGSDELFLNSFATGPEVDGGAVYVASNENMYRLVVDKHGKIHADEASGAWKAPYERGPRFTSIKIADGTGSTPSLMGYGPDEDKLVVFTDGAKKMNLVAMWRDNIPAHWKQKPGTLSPRIADQREVDLGGDISTVQSEQSVAVYDGHAFVVNNIPSEDQPVLSKASYYVTMLNGMTRPTPRGVAMLKWDSEKDQWNPLWNRTDVGSISIVPMISGGSRMALINGFYSGRLGEGYQIGMDLDTGKTVLEIATGSDPVFNGMYAPMKVDKQGRLMYGMAFGLVLMDTDRMQKVEQVAKGE